MKRLLLRLALVALSAVALAGNPHVLMNTSAGDVELELFPDVAPVTVKNFLDYVKKGHYDGTIFHRVIPNFMVQGGGYTSAMAEKPTSPPIFNEAKNGLSNVNGSLAMAREAAPNTARAQFYINVRDNPFLNYAPFGGHFGYAVFGRVIRGMDVVQQIAIKPTGPGPFPGMTDVPLTPIVIKHARVLSAGEASPVPADAPNPFPAPPQPVAPTAPAAPTPADGVNNTIPTQPVNTPPADAETKP
jgi:cyclophilin family peptidyl-prolyl cis-trans isomerase